MASPRQYGVDWAKVANSADDKYAVQTIAHLACALRTRGPLVRASWKPPPHVLTANSFRTEGASVPPVAERSRDPRLSPPRATIRFESALWRRPGLIRRFRDAGEALNECPTLSPLPWLASVATITSRTSTLDTNGLQDARDEVVEMHRSPQSVDRVAKSRRVSGAGGSRSPKMVASRCLLILETPTEPESHLGPARE